MKSEDIIARIAECVSMLTALADSLKEETSKEPAITFTDLRARLAVKAREGHGEKSKS